MSDGHFSSKPIRSGRRSDFASFGTGEFTAEATSAGAARSFHASPAVQREVNALLDQPFPEVSAPPCAPLPKRTPRGALELGRPIASAVQVQEYLIGLIFLRVCGWIFIAFGALMLVGAVGMAITLAAGQDQRNSLTSAAMMGAMGIGIAGAGAWFGILRGRVVNQMCWFCPHGMVWRNETIFDWYPWEEVPEVYCKLRAAGPAVGIRFDAEVAWISFSNSAASHLIVDYIENRASAASLPAALNAIAEGRSVAFGNWRLRRSALDAQGEAIEWKNVAEIERDDRDLVLHHGQRRTVTIPLDETPYPSLFTALLRATYAHAREHGT